MTPSQVVTPWLHAAANAPANQCRVQDRTFTTTSTSNSLTTVEIITESVAGVTVARTTEVRQFSRGWGAVLSASNVVETALGTFVTTTQYDGNGYPWKTTHPDGTTTINLRYTLNGTSAPFSNALLQADETFHGEVSGANNQYVNGRRNLTLTDPKTGTIAQQQVWEVRGGTPLLTQDDRTTGVDSHWRVTTNTTLLGTSTTDYSCCGVSQTVDADGIGTYYTYDDLKRQVTVSRAGVTTSNVYDAADRVIATYRYPTNDVAAATLVSASTYNTAGELVSTTDALTHTTSYSNWVDAAGYIFRQTTYPDGSYRREQSYRDGQLYQVTGTAVHGLQYNYSVVSTNGYGVLVSRETKMDGTNAKEWTETWTDGNGRQIKTVRSGDVPVSQSGYNTKGQLDWQCDADGITNRFGYNAAGEQIVTMLADRITSNATTIADRSGVAVLRRETWQYSDTGPVSVSTSDTTGDGLRSWQTSFNLTSSSVTAINPASQTRTVTVVAPDGSQTVSEYKAGRLQRTTRTAGGTQLARLTYGYDALNRVVTNNDTRTLTLTAYNDADQVMGVNTGGQVSYFHYDAMGRRTNTVMADGAKTYVSYLLTGEPSTNWGDRTYPVAYTYDYAGRMQTMTTWTNFAGNAGAAVTTWNYDANSGQLANKRYHDNLGPDYTYSPAGRLQTRTWARGVVTTYGYNNAGDLLTVAYSDNTPWVTNTYNRLGRRVAASSAADAVSYSYNAAGQLLAETHTAGPLAGLVVTNSYDSLLRREQLSVVGTAGPAVRFAYDSASRLQTVSAGTLSAAYAYVPGAPGLVSNVTFWSAGAPLMKTAKTYDNLNRLLKIESTTGGRPVSSHTYQLNAANQRTKRTDADGSFWNYGYDSLGQVTNAVRYWVGGTNVLGQSYSYLFDDIGNRRFSVLSSQSSVYTANLLNQYTQRTVPGSFWEMGSAHSNATVTVNQAVAARQGEYWAHCKF